MPKELDENKSIPAADILKDPESIYTLTNQYVMLREMSMMGSYSNTIEAINLLGDMGWEVVQLINDSSGTMYALLRNTKYKRKNQM
ncbi:MAG: hypothetical protein KC496_06680 [Anaerolineae bacterium]|nr:hypothetical protein [Anaerolineae bacterium]